MRAIMETFKGVKGVFTRANMKAILGVIEKTKKASKAIMGLLLGGCMGRDTYGA